jgi:hypothetical protein
MTIEDKKINAAAVWPFPMPVQDFTNSEVDDDDEEDYGEYDEEEDEDEEDMFGGGPFTDKEIEERAKADPNAPPAKWRFPG